MSIGSPDAKVTVKVFSSLTCPHCATFHTSIFNKLKKEYIDEGLVRFEHHAFPLDLAALNAEIVVQNKNKKKKKKKKNKIETKITIYKNKKKYSGKVDYKKFKKIIEKNL